jgi:hypothetical protein
MHDSTVEVIIKLTIPVTTQLPPEDMTVKQFKKTIASHLVGYLDVSNYTTDDAEKMIRDYRIVKE